MIGKIIFVIYVFSEVMLSVYAHSKKKKVIIGDEHPLKKIISLGINGTIWYVIFTYW